jgi:hypothetical protein
MKFISASVLQDVRFKGLKIRNAILDPESFPSQWQREECVAMEHAPTHDEIQGRMQLEQEKVARTQGFEIHLTARPPKIHLIGTDGR